MSNAQPAYAHTQIGYGILLMISLLVGGVVAIVTPALAASGPQPPAVWIILLGSVAIVYATLLLFSRMHVEVRDGMLTWHFGFGFPKFNVAIKDIAEARTVQNSLIYGFGIRVTPGGMLYNVAGKSAVQVVLTGGRRVQIGTDDPDGLLAMVSAARGAASRST